MDLNLVGAAKMPPLKCERLWQKKQHGLPHLLKEILKLNKEMTMKGTDRQFEVGTYIL